MRIKLPERFQKILKNPGTPLKKQRRNIIMEIRKKLLAAYAFFAVIAAIWSWFSIRGMYRGSLIFMQKIHQGVCDPFSLHAMTAAAAILAAAFLASLFLFVRSYYEIGRASCRERV